MIKPLTTAALVAAMILGGASAAFAQTTESEKTKDVTVYDFPEEVVKGNRATGAGDVIEGEGPRKTKNLIKPRLHFVPELIKSAENL